MVKHNSDTLTNKTELYGLQHDPQERIDVASEHVSLADSMLSRLKDFMSVHKTGPLLPPLSLEEAQRLKSLGYL